MKEQKIKSTEQPIEIEEFVRQTIEKVQNALPKGWRVKDVIRFEISIIKTTKGKGGLKMYVAELSGDCQKESISKICFEVTSIPLGSYSDE